MLLCCLRPTAFICPGIRGDLPSLDLFQIRLHHRIWFFRLLHVLQWPSFCEVPLQQLLQLGSLLDSLLSICKFLLESFQFLEHVFMANRILQTLLPKHSHLVVPALDHSTDQLVVWRLIHAQCSSQLALIALPNTFADGHPIQHLAQLSSFAFLGLDQLLMRALGWILFQCMQVRLTGQSEHMAYCHGHQRAHVIARQPQHVVTAEVGARQIHLHPEALLGQHHRSRVHDPKLVTNFSLTRRSMIREEGMSLRIESQQIPELSVKGFEERQTHQPSRHRQVQVLNNHRAKELPLFRKTVQDDHGPLLRDLPKDTQRGRLDAGRSGLRDSQHGQLTCDGSSGQMSHADHIFDLLRFGFLVMAFILIFFVTDVHICRAIEQNEHGIATLAFVHHQITRHENTVHRRVCQLSDEVGVRIAEKWRFLDAANQVLRICLLTAIGQHEHLHPLIREELQRPHHHRLMQQLTAAMLHRQDLFDPLRARWDAQSSHHAEGRVGRQSAKPLVFRQGGSDTIGHDMHHTSSSRQFEVTNGFSLQIDSRFKVILEVLQEFLTAPCFIENVQDAKLGKCHSSRLGDEAAQVPQEAVGFGCVEGFGQGATRKEPAVAFSIRLDA
mmetsp:Transcript_31277/g.67454  ORF Transcript_31277/g.67454 Transcript_31277/m.67454 type:complete len:611 (-) Transcript_31277:345-2177(-)